MFLTRNGQVFNPCHPTSRPKLFTDPQPWWEKISMTVRKLTLSSKIGEGLVTYPFEIEREKYIGLLACGLL